MYQAKTNLSHFVARAVAGEDIVLAKSGTPLARLIPYERLVAERKPGKFKGKIQLPKNFNAPMPDVEKLFVQKLPE